MKFKVGDIIIATEFNYHGPRWTNKKHEVIRYNERVYTLKILEVPEDSVMIKEGDLNNEAIAQVEKSYELYERKTKRCNKPGWF